MCRWLQHPEKNAGAAEMPPNSVWALPPKTHAKDATASDAVAPTSDFACEM